MRAACRTIALISDWRRCVCGVTSMWFCSLHLSRAVDYKHAAPTGLCERTEGRSIPRCVSEVLSALRAGSRWTEAPPAGAMPAARAMGHMCRSTREVSAGTAARTPSSCRKNV